MFEGLVGDQWVSGAASNWAICQRLKFAPSQQPPVSQQKALNSEKLLNGHFLQQQNSFQGIKSLRGTWTGPTTNPFRRRTVCFWSKNKQNVLWTMSQHSYERFPLRVSSRCLDSNYFSIFCVVLLVFSHSFANYSYCVA